MIRYIVYPKQLVVVNQLALRADVSTINNQLLAIFQSYHIGLAIVATLPLHNVVGGFVDNHILELDRKSTRLNSSHL